MTGARGGRRGVLRAAAAAAAGLAAAAARRGPVPGAARGAAAGTVLGPAYGLLLGSAASEAAAASDPAAPDTATTAAAAPDGPPAAGWPALRLLDGGTWAPESWDGLAGVLVVWATWCPYCHRHNARVEALHRAVAGRPMRVLGASLDVDPEQVRRHLRERGYTFPNTMQADLLRTRFGLRRVTPMTVTFDRRGRILERIPGEMAEADMMALARLADTPA